LPRLGNRGDGSDGCGDSVDIDLGVDLAGGVLLRAVAGDVASLTALVASLASRVERATVGSSAVAGDVAELAAGVALHGLSLAITSEVVGAAALVAGGRARAAGESATAAKATVAAAGNGSTATHGTGADRVGAGAGQMAGLAAVVASTAGTGAAQAQGRAVGLDVAKTLAVVALLGLGATRQRAAVRLMAGLLAVVAETLS
jgi:hypothetical protein